MSKPKKMTPEEFKRRMALIESDDDYDTEEGHAKADALLCECLESLGYAEGVAIFRELHKWYA
jgi:hypothetical protein